MGHNRRCCHIGDGGGTGGRAKPGSAKSVMAGPACSSSTDAVTGANKGASTLSTPGGAVPFPWASMSRVLSFATSWVNFTL